MGGWAPSALARPATHAPACHSAHLLKRACTTLDNLLYVTGHHTACHTCTHTCIAAYRRLHCHPPHSDTALQLAFAPGRLILSCTLLPGRPSLSGSVHLLVSPFWTTADVDGWLQWTTWQAHRAARRRLALYCLLLCLWPRVALRRRQRAATKCSGYVTGGILRSIHSGGRAHCVSGQ